MKKFLIVIIFVLLSKTYSLAEVPYFLDFKMILNESTAGKKRKLVLKKLENGFNQIKKEKKKYWMKKKTNPAKKIISNEEYKKKLSSLRERVSSIQKERTTLLQNVANQRAKAKKTLLENLNPIVKDYMKEKKIRMVVDKKSILLADENLDITQEIINQLNKKLKSIKLD